MALVKCSEFVKRQTEDSGYSHFEGSWEELEQLTERYVNEYPIFTRPGYRDGVIIVDLPGWQFKSAIVKLDEKTNIKATYSPRREGENPYIRISAKSEKQTAVHASVVLYRADVLAEDNDRSSSGADWEIVAIKARMTEEEEPMDPYTMARNFLHLPGGTKGDFTAEQFAKSIVYWNNHCMTTSKTSWWKKIYFFIKNF